jgi:dihydropyrimidinase
VIAFANQKRVGTSLFPVVEEYHSRARGCSYVDYGFHLILTNPTLKILGDELPIMVECEGITNVKLYMTYPAMRLGDGEMLDITLQTRALGINQLMRLGG